MPSPFKVTIGNHSHTIRIGRSEVAAIRSYIANDLTFKGGLEVTNWRVCVARTFELDLKVTNVGVYVQQIQDRRVCGIGAIHGHVSMFYRR